MKKEALMIEIPTSTFACPVCNTNSVGFQLFFFEEKSLFGSESQRFVSANVVCQNCDENFEIEGKKRGLDKILIGEGLRKIANFYLNDTETLSILADLVHKDVKDLKITFNPKI